MLTDRLDDTTFHLLMLAYLIVPTLVGIALVLWDTAHEMHPGEEPVLAADLGEIPTPAEQQHLAARARFERMDGVL
ncbi:hypothetical protein ACQR10_04410 [Bradyrhizobium sp. HKCCYLRH2060]|uniref:hypothetical protein n=1 Tax=Bradyrhizobium sp. HKCCYLRH2060 TaxID=3420743 RepID=UPI003EBE80F2